MAGSFGFRYCLLLLAVSQVVGRNSDCYNDYRPDPYLYLKYEEALVKKHGQLEELRAIFISDPPRYVYLFVDVSVINVTNRSCDNTTAKHTFCASQNTSWELCNNLLMTILEYKTECSKNTVLYPILYVSLLHGSLTTIYWSLLEIKKKHFVSCYGAIFKQIELKLDKLKCNPSFHSMQRVLSEMFSWVSNFGIIITLSVFNTHHLGL